MSPSKSADRPSGLPEPLAHLHGATWQRNRVGRSGMQVYRAETGKETFYLKVDPERTGELEDEAARLRWIAGRLPAPAVRFSGLLEDGCPALLMTALPGDSLIAPEHLGDPPRLAGCLEQSLRLLKQVPVADCPFDAGLDVALLAAQQRVSAGKVDKSCWNPETTFSSPESLLAYLLDNRPPDTPPVFIHGDFCLPNILATDDAVTGLIDWSRGGVGDRWRDLALASWTLNYNLGSAGNRVFLDLLSRLDVRPDPYRTEYFILLEELF